MKGIVLIVIACLMINEISQAQYYVGTWHLVKIIQDDDTLNVSFDENSDYVDELTVYAKKSDPDTLEIDALFESKVKEVYQIARNYYLIVRLDAETFEKRYIKNACYCHFSYSLKEPNLWYQFCESSIILFEVSLKNENLYLQALKKDTWKEEVFEQEIYIYEKGAININDDK